MNIDKTDKTGKALKLGDRVKCMISIYSFKPFEISGVIKQHKTGGYYIKKDDDGGFWSLESKTIDWSTMEVESEE